jgi:hypothetical protein
MQHLRGCDAIRHEVELYKNRLNPARHNLCNSYARFERSCLLSKNYLTNYEKPDWEFLECSISAFDLISLRKCDENTIAMFEDKAVISVTVWREHERCAVVVSGNCVGGKLYLNL